MNIGLKASKSSRNIKNKVTQMKIQTMTMTMMRKRSLKTCLQSHKCLSKEEVYIKASFIYFLGTSIFKKDASNGLSYEKMLYNVDKTHPRINIRDPHSMYISHNFTQAVPSFILSTLFARHALAGPVVVGQLDILISNNMVSALHFTSSSWSI